MKLMFISDIHGSLFYLEKALLRFDSEQADQLIILGDLLYHGPRNPLPEGYQPAEVAKKLNSLKNKIICVRGNCDSEVDQMVIEFPIMADYSWLFVDGKRIFATHGHTHNMETLPSLSEGDILIHGHTHVPVAQEMDGLLWLNPGSIALPKENSPHSYGILEAGHFVIKDLDGNAFKSIDL